MLIKKLEADIKKIILEMGFKVDDIVISIPQDPAHGDYSTNIALQLAKQNKDNSKQNSLEIANHISQKLQNLDYLDKVEVAPPGFINLFVKPEYLVNEVKLILNAGGNYGKSDFGKDRKARVEFVSANPTGPLHIGNARGGPLGDVISLVLEFVGFEVLREYIHNNEGVQIQALGETLKALVSGTLSEENQYKGEYINELAKKLEGKIKEKTEEETGREAAEIMLEEIVTDSQAMGIKFDLIVKESQLRQKAPEVLEKLKSSGVLKEKEGALWLAPSDEFLKDRETVVVKSNGEYTYFTSDIVYHKDKFESGANLIIDVFGSNHHGHVPRIQAAMKALGFDTEKLKVVLYQYVRVKRGQEIVKMSKRAGNFVTAREVLDEVGKDAFRFLLLNFDPQTHIDFDLELVKKQSNENPVFYVQYAHARMANILNKAGNLDKDLDLLALKTAEELRLIKHLISFPDLVKQISLDLQVHRLTFYAITLAELFHKFYESCRVLNAETEELKQARLALVSASKIVLGNTLNLLGISAPEKM